MAHLKSLGMSPAQLNAWFDRAGGAGRPMHPHHTLISHSNLVISPLTSPNLAHQDSPEMSRHTLVSSSKPTHLTTLKSSNLTSWVKTLITWSESLIKQRRQPSNISLCMHILITAGSEATTGKSLPPSFPPSSASKLSLDLELRYLISNCKFCLYTYKCSPSN